MSDVRKANMVLEKRGLYNYKIATTRENNKIYYVLYKNNGRTKQYLGNAPEILTLFNGIHMCFHSNPAAQQVVEEAKQEYCA